eukprot:6182467-Pyramimonas_sp.AAC.1
MNKELERHEGAQRVRPLPHPGREHRQGAGEALVPFVVRKGPQEGVSAHGHVRHQGELGGAQVLEASHLQREGRPLRCKQAREQRARATNRPAELGAESVPKATEGQKKMSRCCTKESQRALNDELITTCGAPAISEYRVVRVAFRARGAHG